MKVLDSPKSFCEHYVTDVTSAGRIVAATGSGVTAAGSVVGVSTAAASAAAVNASAWSVVAGLPLVSHMPLVGGFVAGKVAAVGTAAAAAAATSAAVLVPAGLILGAGVACAICFRKKKKSLHKGSTVDDLADAFARVAWLPMLACAASVCQSSPASTDAVRDYVAREMCAWGYAKPYVMVRFDEAVHTSVSELGGRYQWAMRQLESGSTEGIGATPAELPHVVVGAFAKKFWDDIELCMG